MNDKTTKEEEEEILKIVRSMDNKENDCPEELIKLAKTPFERTVCIEFYKLYKEFQSFKISTSKDMKWLKWLITATFGIVVLALAIQLMDNFLSHVFV